MTTTYPIAVLLVAKRLRVRAGLRMLIESDPRMRVVGEAGNRSDALSTARLEQPDLVLMLLDPGENGTELFAELRSACPSARVLLLTGFRDVEAHRHPSIGGSSGLLSTEQVAQLLVKAIERADAAQGGSDEATKSGTLTHRDREVLALVAEGRNDRQIAERLVISETTLRHHLSILFNKLGVSDRLELVLYAYAHRLPKPPSAPS